MTAKLKSVAWGCIALVCGSVSAQIRDGAYTGTIDCGPLITNPQQGAWSQPVQLTVSGQSVAWERLDSRLSESGSGMLRNGRVSFNLDGRWNPGQRSTGQWRNVVMLEWKNAALSGPATIFSANGEQRLRDCSVRVAIPGVTDTTAGASRRAAQPAANTPQVLSGLPAAAAAVVKSVVTLPPVSASAAVAERALRDQEANREKDALRERAIRENDERIARQREAQRREDEQAQRVAQVRSEARRRDETSWEQQRQEDQRKYEAERKAKEEQENQRQLAWKQKEARDAQERAAEQAKYEARAKTAATRHADRIKALGLPSAFINATLYVNNMGNWEPLLPCAQWLGLLFDNPKIASVQAISVRGMPGVTVKRTGQPATGAVFRMEGNEAYVWGAVAEGKAEEVRTPHEHTLMGMALKEITIDRGKP